MDILREIANQGSVKAGAIIRGSGMTKALQIFYFHYAINNDDDVQLNYNEIDLIDAGEFWFNRLALEIGIDKAVEEISRSDPEKAQYEFIERGLASEYITKLLMRHPEVIERAENAAIEIYRGI